MACVVSYSGAQTQAGGSSASATQFRPPGVPPNMGFGVGSNRQTELFGFQQSQCVSPLIKKNTNFIKRDRILYFCIYF